MCEQGLHSTVNEFLMLANKQFFENRVYDDDDHAEEDEDGGAESDAKANGRADSGSLPSRWSGPGRVCGRWYDCLIPVSGVRDAGQGGTPASSCSCRMR